MSDVLNQLSEVLEQRKHSDAKQSYVASLHVQGLNKILEKVGEEATEVILAAKDAQGSGNNNALIEETADLWFHCMVMLSHLGTDASEVLNTLNGRFELSGLAEKAARGKTAKPDNS